MQQDEEAMIKLALEEALLIDDYYLGYFFMLILQILIFLTEKIQ